MKKRLKTSLRPVGGKVTYPNHKYSFRPTKHKKSRLKKKLLKYEFFNEDMFQYLLDSKYPVNTYKRYPINLDTIPSDGPWFDFDSPDPNYFEFHGDLLDDYWKYHDMIIKMAPRWRQIILAEMEERKND